MSFTTSTTRTRFLLTTAAFLLLNTSTTLASPQGFGGGGPGGWRDGNDGDEDDWQGCYWGGDGCDNGDNDDDGDGSTSSSGPFDSGVTASYNSTARIITVHAVLASLVWVFLIPLAAILIRAPLKTPHLLTIHATLQSLSLLTYVVAAALGIYLIQHLPSPSSSLYSDPHTKLGLAILVLAIIQPVLGVVHHRIYKRRAQAVKSGSETAKQPGRTIPGHAHIWLGRILIVLGMINGGLGLRLAARSPYETNVRGKAIAYGVCAAVMFLVYIVFAVMGEMRRMKERGQVRGEVGRGYQGVPLESRERDGEGGRGVGVGGVLPGYSGHQPQPPSYEDSQENLGGKERHTTARYQ